MLIWMDGFDHYGVDPNLGDLAIPNNMLAGAYGSVQRCGIDTPDWGPRTGLALHTGFGGELRKVLPTSEPVVLIGAGVSFPSLPEESTKTQFVMFKNGGNSPIAHITITATGAISFNRWVDSTNYVLEAQTAVPVLVPRNWHFLEMKFDMTAHTFRLDVDGETVLNLSGLALLGTSCPMVSLGNSQAGIQDGQDVWFDDFTIRTPDGAHNNDFEGDLRVATLFPNANGTAQGWTPQYRHKFGNGILATTNALAPYGDFPSDSFPSAVWTGSNPMTDLGNGDFTIEGWFRFFELPANGDMAHLFGKWDETNNRRSFQLYIGGPAREGGNIVFRTSTNGLAGTVVEKINYPFPNGGAPDLDRWYNIALVRSAGELLLFLDGIQLGPPIPDADTYYAGVEMTSVGCQVEGTSSIIQHTWFNGFVDELRWTVGTGRYTGNYAVQTAPFPRSSADTYWNDVVWLSGFDNGINDESQFGLTVNIYNSSSYTPDDGAAAFQAIYHRTPQDDTFVEAALLAATDILTLDVNPTAGDFVTVGSYTSAGSHPAVYTFVAAVAAPFDVKIGATPAITQANFVAAVNVGAGAGTLYGTGTIINDDVFAGGLPGVQSYVQALAAGASGNALTATSSLTSGGSGWHSPTLTGGQDIPGVSDFFMDRPPPNTVLVKAVQIMNRSFKTDAGAGSIQVSFIGPLGTVVPGADNPLTLSPSYRWDIYETDPDTGGTLTPATIVGGRVRLNRTE